MTEQTCYPALSQLRDALITQLRDLNYSSSTIECYEYVIRQLGNYMESTGIAIYSPAVGSLFIESFCSDRPEHSCRNIQAGIHRLNDCLLGKGYRTYHCKRQSPATPSEYALIEAQYLEHCAEKGNAPSTLKIKKTAFAQFMHYLDDAGCHSLCELTAEHVMRAILFEHNQYLYGYYREILKFLVKKDLVAHDYSTLVPKFRRPYHLPSTYDRDERIRLENSPDSETAQGKRDYAIILLANRLGMRSGDIAGLTFSKIDFCNDAIRFDQFKTSDPHELCLVPDVKEAISDYIINGRPSIDDDHIFIMHKAPYAAVSAIAIHGIVAKGFRLAGIDTTNKKHGAHSLRASLATDMVNSGESYDQTRKVLGHRSPDAIKNYAKLDVERLRLCALGARSASGFFERFLKGEEVLP